MYLGRNEHKSYVRFVLHAGIISVLLFLSFSARICEDGPSHGSLIRKNNNGFFTFRRLKIPTKSRRDLQFQFQNSNSLINFKETFAEMSRIEERRIFVRVKELDTTHIVFD